MTGHDSRRVSPFGHPRIEARSSSPRLIAAYDALHRLPAPRHPPYALSSLTMEQWISLSVCSKHFLRRFSYQRAGWSPEGSLLNVIELGWAAGPAHDHRLVEVS